MEAIISLIFLFALVAGAVALGRGHSRKVDAAWRAFADKHGVTFEPKKSWYKGSRGIAGNVGGAAIKVDHYTVSSGQSSITYTRIRAPTPGTGKLKLKVTKKHALSGVTRALGFQDVATGDTSFDEAYTVKANDDDLARAWLNADVRRAIVAAGKYALEVSGGQVTIQHPVLEKDPNALEAAALAAAAVATRGEEIRAGWQRFADASEGALTHDNHGNLRIEIEHENVPLRIEAEGIAAGDHTYTRIVGHVVGERGEAFELSAAALEDDERMKFLAPMKIDSDGERVTMVLRGVETDEVRLRKACDIVQDLANKKSGAYR
jgi:hypothetical protein